MTIEAVDTTGAELTPELADLMEHEKVIEQGLASFVEVGNALLAIKAAKKYRHAGYSTFEDYCQRRWGFTRQRAHQLTVATATYESIDRALDDTRQECKPAVDIPRPSDERQVRPLTSLPEPERAGAWTEAVDRAEGEQPTAAEVAEVVNERRTPKPVPKPAPKVNGERVEGAKPHPAAYSDAVLAKFRELLRLHYSDDGLRLLDPFAGTGRIHELHAYGWDTVGVELEPEWGALYPERTIIGDSRDLPFADADFDVIATSPAYGNRLADHYDAYDPQARRSYSIDLGRKLTDGNGAGLQWGDEYRHLHMAVWAECVRVLRHGGLLLLNCKDHRRDGEIIPVTSWHKDAVESTGLQHIDCRSIDAAGLPFTTAEPLPEIVHCFRKP